MQVDNAVFFQLFAEGFQRVLDVESPLSPLWLTVTVLRLAET